MIMLTSKTLNAWFSSPYHNMLDGKMQPSLHITLFYITVTHTTLTTTHRYINIHSSARFVSSGHIPSMAAGRLCKRAIQSCIIPERDIETASLLWWFHSLFWGQSTRSVYTCLGWDEQPQTGTRKNGFQFVYLFISAYYIMLIKCLCLWWILC